MGDDFLAKKTVETVFDELDLDGSGKVEFSEFLVASMQREKIVSKDKIEKAFKLIDQVTLIPPVLFIHSFSPTIIASLIFIFDFFLDLSKLIIIMNVLGRMEMSRLHEKNSKK